MGKRWLALVITLLLGIAGESEGKEKLTLEAIFADESLEGRPARVSFTPDGFSLFVLKESNGESLLMLQSLQGEEKLVVRETQLVVPDKRDTKLPLTGYHVSPQGSHILLTDGRDLFVYEIASARLRALTASEEKEELASFSPDGTKVSFVRGNDLYLVDIATGQERRLTFDGSETKLNGKLDWVYTEELYNRSSRGYAWSPDSRHILFLSFDIGALPRYPLVNLLKRHPEVTFLRYPKAGDTNATVTVNVVGVGAGTFPGVHLSFSGSPREYVARFGWLPAGDSFWLLFLSRDQRDAELVTFELPLGNARVVLREHDEAWINVENDILWMKSGSLIFGSERSGFRQIYRLDPGSQQPYPITSGTFDITAILGFDEQERELYFIAAHPSPLERHLFRVSLSGGRLAQLTRDPGTHNVQAAKHCRFFLDRFSDPKRLPQTQLLDQQGKLIRLIPYEKPPELDRFQLGETSFYELQGPSGDRLYASLLKPANFDPKKRYPVIVYVYGGPHAQVVRKAWGGRPALFHHFLAQEGFLVFSLDNRGSAARGRNFERVLYRRLGKAELEDQLAGVAWLAQQPYVDSNRLGIWGWSYGGFMTLYALTHSTAFRTGVAVAPVTDWRHYDTIYTERYLKLPEENDTGYQDSSPVTAANQLAAPLLLVHGTGDDNVHWQNTLNFVQALIQAEKPYHLLLYPNKDHGIPGKQERFHLFSAIYQHFLQHLSTEDKAHR